MQKCIILLFLTLSASASIQFDGTDDFVNFGTIDIVGNKTISLWFFEATAPETAAIFGNCAADYSEAQYWVSSRSTGNVRFTWANAGEESHTTTTNVLTADAWHHILITHTGASNAPVIYIDGASQGLSATGNTTVPAAGFGETYLGCEAEGADAFTDAIITEVAVWDMVLSAADIASVGAKIKQMPLQIQPANLVAYWPLDDEEAGTSCDGDTFFNLANPGTNNGTGDDGANNTGLTSAGETILNYPAQPVGP